MSLYSRYSSGGYDRYRGKENMNRTILIACLLILAPTSWSSEPLSPIERYRRLEFPPKEENFEKGWKDRVAADYDVINSADLISLRAALKEGDPFVRAIAAYALGVRSDKVSADALAELVQNVRVETDLCDADSVSRRCR